MDKRPIVIIASMKEETDFLKEKLENFKEIKNGIYTFWEGKMYNYPVVIIFAGIGVINSSVATYIAINNYNPILIINEGTAGGFDRNIHTKDIVIGEKCININSYKTPSKAIGEGSNSLNWENVTFIPGEDDREIFWRADKELIELAKKVNYKEGNIHVGIIGSGDIWNKELDRIILLNNKFGILCEEMEGIGVYTVANNFNISVIGIRVISDNEILGEEFDRNTGLYSQKFTYKLIEKIVERKEIV